MVQFGIVSLSAILVCGCLSLAPYAADATGATSRAEFQVFRDLPRANNIEMWTLDGSPVSLDALRGKVVILNFWRQNCRWCHLEKRYLRSLVRDLNRSDLQVVCANLWDHPGWIRRYAERESEGLLFTTRGDDPRCVVENVVKGRLMGYYVVNGAKEAIYEVKGFPTSYVIDGDGRVVATHVGMVRWDSRSILDWIAGLVGRDKGQEAVAGAEYRSPAWLDRLMTTGVGRP